MMLDAPRPQIMGIVNVTPDSFSDGGDFYNPETAIAHGLKLLSEGADILDIGGESTRPGAKPVPEDDEISRILPVISELSKHTNTLSIDTRNAKTMEKALEAGATIINDVSALTHDKAAVHVAAASDATLILMHAQGNPVDMQKNTHYNSVIEDIKHFLNLRIKYCEAHRIDKKKLIIDPGIGFGKTLQHNLLILRYIKDFQDMDVPIMLGVSRKRFISDCGAPVPEKERLGGSLAAALWGIQNGARYLRVHDVKETRQALDVLRSIEAAH